jgi:3-oxoadipate enol-lactonase
MRPSSSGSEGFVPVRGGRLWYEERGEGPVVVLIHAGIADARMWDAQMDAFAERHRTIRYDLRAFGRSDTPLESFSMTGDLCELMDGLGVERAAIVGVSMGGALAIDMAAAHPDRVWALVPVASALSGYEWPDDDPALAEIEAAEHAGDRERAVDLGLELWAPLSSGPAIDDLIRRMAHENAKADDVPDDLVLRLDPPAIERLEEIRAPTLVVLGDHDLEDIETIAEVVADRVPWARKVVIPNTDHLPPMRAPEEFNRIVMAFLEEVGSSATR